MMWGGSVGLPIDRSRPLYAFLPFAVVLGVHWGLGLFSHRDQVSSTTHPSQKEHLDETLPSRPVA
jgi:hypothetical protein